MRQFQLRVKGITFSKRIWHHQKAGNAGADRFYRLAECGLAPEFEQVSTFITQGDKGDFTPADAPANLQKYQFTALLDKLQVNSLNYVS